MALEAHFIENFLENLLVSRGLSQNTIQAYGRDLKNFAPKTPSASKTRVEHVQTYLRNLAKNGVSPRTQARHFTSLRVFFKFLEEEGHISQNPTLNIKSPKIPASLPKALSGEDVQKIFNVLDDKKPQEHMLKTMLLLLYATGMRVGEMTSLKVGDATTAAEEGFLQITGKGGKTRLVPVGQNMADRLENYISTQRPQLNTNGGVFLFPAPRKNKSVTREYVYRKLHNAGVQAGVNVSPHTLRHTFATHLLENGADLPAVQAMLGHASLATTQIYTKIADNHLQKVLEQHHPLAKRKKNGDD